MSGEVVDLLEDPDGAPYPEEVQEFYREAAEYWGLNAKGPIEPSVEDREHDLSTRLVEALESIANHYRQEQSNEVLFYRYQIALLADTIEHGALRWEEPLPVPGYVEDLDKILAGRTLDDMSPTCVCKWHEGMRGKQRAKQVLLEAALPEVQPEGASEAAYLSMVTKMVGQAMGMVPSITLYQRRRVIQALLFGDPDGPSRVEAGERLPFSSGGSWLPPDPEGKLNLTVVPGDGPPLSMSEVNRQMSRMEALEREIKRAHLPAWWVSWWTVPGEGWELHTPWWTTGYREGPEGEQRSICAAVRAASEEEAWAVIQNAHDNPNVSLDWRFTQRITEEGGAPYPDRPWTDDDGRFPKAAWMVWAGKDLPGVEYYPSPGYPNHDGSCGCPCHLLHGPLAAHERACCSAPYEKR